MLRLKLFLLLIIFPCSFLNSTAWAVESVQQWDSSRDYEPIILKGSNFNDFLGRSVSDIFAYVYDSIEDKWIQIPLQIDEQDDSSHVWLPSPNNVLDSNDEIVFLARDMGDKAQGPNDWLDNPGSRENIRYEIAATDYNDSNKRAYAYFYLSATIPDTSAGYMSYTEAPVTTGSDTVSGISYTEGHNDKGISDYWNIPISAGGNGENLLDRQKVRVSAFSVVPIELTEDNIINPTIESVTGKVRVARKIRFTIYKDFEIDDVEICSYYYPYSIEYKGATEILDPIYKIDHIRQSFDLNSNAMGMRFYNNFNTNLQLDGSPTADDTIHKNLVYNPDINWYMLSGSQGTILTLMKLDSLANDSLYYYDNSSGGTGDGKEDTGDGESWGDVGILITGTALESGFSLPYTIYYLPQNQPAEIGPQYSDNFRYPLGISINSMVVPVELASFKAEVSTRDVSLTWITVSESNNYGFEIHRKTQQETTWQIVDFVQGHNTSNIPHIYSYTDCNLVPGIYFYRLKQIDSNGASEFSNIIEVNVAIPDRFALEQNFPNPFNPGTTIKYQIPAMVENNATVNLTIYNLVGSKVKTLISTEQSPGYHKTFWDGKDEQGNVVPTGMYVYRICVGKNVATKRMVLMK